MSDPIEHGAAAAAQAARAAAIAAVRKRAQTALEQHQRNVLQLLEEMHLRVETPPVHEAALPQHPRSDEGKEHSQAAVSRQEAIDMVRAEIATLDLATLVKAEIETQLRAVTKQLQERLKASPQTDLRKISPSLSRRRR